MEKSYEKKWNDIVATYAFDVYALDELETEPEIQVRLFTQLEIIFGQLKKMSRKRIFKQRELDVTWVMLRSDILYLNDLSMEGGVLKQVYGVVVDIFNELIKMYEIETDYECAANLLNFRNLWLNSFNIKLKVSNAE